MSSLSRIFLAKEWIVIVSSTGRTRMLCRTRIFFLLFVVLALKQIARDHHLATPDLFLDPGYVLSNHFSLSTSQVTTNINDSFICYGAVVPDGYGCSYNVRSDYILFCISSFHSCLTTNSRDFAESLTDTLYEIRDLCTLVQRQQQTLALRRPSYAAKMVAQQSICLSPTELHEHTYHNHTNE